MKDYAAPIARLIDEFAKLPGIGRKTATKLAFWMIEREEADVKLFSAALLDAKHKIRFCNVCGHFSEGDICDICSDSERNQNTIVVVEEARDVFAIEQLNEYRGLYHVLHGAISPLDGIGPEDLNLKSLVSRLTNVDEVILATNTTIEGEATAIYISRLLSTLGIRISRIAKGIPIGGDIEYADEITLLKAIEQRVEMK